MLAVAVGSCWDEEQYLKQLFMWVKTDLSLGRFLLEVQSWLLKPLIHNSSRLLLLFKLLEVKKPYSWLGVQGISSSRPYHKQSALKRLIRNACACADWGGWNHWEQRHLTVFQSAHLYFFLGIHALKIVPKLLRHDSAANTETSLGNWGRCGDVADLPCSQGSLYLCPPLGNEEDQCPQAETDLKYLSEILMAF